MDQSNIKSPSDRKVWAQIFTEINIRTATKKHCGKDCPHLIWIPMKIGDLCKLFKKRLKHDKKNYLLRCEECVSSEIKRD
jgi:hypothetical protein